MPSLDLEVDFASLKMEDLPWTGMVTVYFLSSHLLHPSSPLILRHQVIIPTSAIYTSYLQDVFRLLLVNPNCQKWPIRLVQWHRDELANAYCLCRSCEWCRAFHRSTETWWVSSSCWSELANLGYVNLGGDRAFNDRQQPIQDPCGTETKRCKLYIPKFLQLRYIC